MTRPRHPTPSRDLARWCEDHLYTLAAFARLVDSDRISISRIVHRRRRPGARLALKIEVATGIPSASWSREPRASVAP